MATRTALLNGNVINRDTDFSKHIEAISEPGVIKGLAVSSSSVATGEAFIKCERTNGDIIYAVVYNNSVQEISGNGDVYIEIPQELVDNGELMPEDGSNIAEIKVGTMPSKNALKLAVKSGNTITDARNMIKKSGELLALINQNIEDISDLDDRVEALEEADAIDHLEESGLVGELFTLNDNLFKQNTPTLADSTVDCNVSNTSDNAQIHIQRIGSGVASNQLKLKVKMVGSSTQDLKVEVRKGVKVTVNEGVEAYWYGNQVIASGSIPYSEISSDYAEKTITLNGNFGGTKGELLDIVVYMDTVNASNYYCIACDSTQYSEGFRYVAVNGNVRTKSGYMPYCISNGVMNSLLCKAGDYSSVVATHPEQFIDTTITLYTVTSSHPIKAKLNLDINRGYYGGSCIVYVNGTQIVELINDTSYSTQSKETEFTVKQNDVITLKASTSGTVLNVVLTLYETKSGEIIKTYPRDLADIGEMGYATLFGNHIDKEFKGGIMTGKSTTATTGNITLGNAVGFITVNLNGNIVKIPYYNE